MDAPPTRLTFKIPPVTVSCVVDKLPFVSVTDTPEIAVCVCSLTVCVAGTVLTGGSSTLMAKLSLSVNGVLVLSVDNMVSVSLVVPLLLVYFKLAKAVLIWVSVPLKVKVAVLLLPAVINAPPTKLTFKTPPVTVSCVVAKLPFISVTDTPEIAVWVCSVTVCNPGTVLTGGLTAILLTAIVETTEFELSLPSLVTNVTVRLPSVKPALVFSYVIPRINKFRSDTSISPPPLLTTVKTPVAET